MNRNVSLNNSLDATNEWVANPISFWVFIRILSNAGRANRALLVLARALQHSWGPEPETRAGTLSYTPRINSFYGKINTITIDRASPAPSIQLYQPEHILYDKVQCLLMEETWFIYKVIFLFLKSKQLDLWKWRYVDTTEALKVLNFVRQKAVSPTCFVRIPNSWTLHTTIQIFLQPFNPV